MDILINTPGRDTSRLTRHLKRLNPELRLHHWPDVESPQQIRAAICWEQKPGEFGHYPKLRMIASLGAGVDHILQDPSLPEDVVITRLLDPSLATQMNHYLLKAVAIHERRTGQRRHKVLILGAGQLGMAAAQAFEQAGYQATCWGKLPRQTSPVNYVNGLDAAIEELAKTDVIVCLLPLTDDTKGILNIEFFLRAKRDCLLINVARGMHLDEEDLLLALDSGLLAGAWLDVHRKEPSPPDLRLLTHPKITMTRHTAATSDMACLAEQFVSNLSRMKQGFPLLGAVDPRRGY